MKGEMCDPVIAAWF